MTLMNLIVFGPGHPFRGGIARTTTEMVRALRERGHRVTFFTPRRQYPRWLYPGAGDRDPAACPALPDSHALLDPLAPWSWPRGRRRAFALKADAWLLPYWTWAWAFWWRYLLRGRTRPPVVAVVHNPADHDAGRVQRMAARLVLGRCEALLTHAEELTRWLRELYPGRPTSCHLIPPSPIGELPESDRARHEMGLERTGRVALFLGLIRPYKGVDLLIEAMAELPPDADWRLVVAGEPWGDLGQALHRQVVELGLVERVRLELRWIPEPELPTLLAAADVVVLPYREGSQSAVAPLALGAGVPVVASGVGGLPELLGDGGCGLIVEPGSVASLAAALRSLDAKRLAELAEGARRRAGTITWDSYAATVERLVEQVIGVEG
jgi:glycosyltransferase involved in cell wall biosynthesis